MIVLLVLLLIVLVVFLYLFFAPFYFEINTTDSTYRIRFHRLASISLKMIDRSLMAEIKICWWIKRFELWPGKNGAGKEARIDKTPVKAKKKRKMPFRKIKAVLKSFKISKCSVSVDTGDMQLNGVLWPVFYLFKVRSGKDMRINFIGENKIILEVKNNLARMSWAYISS